MSAGPDTSSPPLATSPPCTDAQSPPYLYPASICAPHPVQTTPQKAKPPSVFLIHWINGAEIHGYEFNEDVLFGYEPDTDWTEGLINQPNSWAEVMKCLRSEISGQKRLKESSIFKDRVDLEYWRGCKLALKEVERFYA